MVILADKKPADRRPDKGHDPHEAKRDLEGVDVGRLELTEDLADVGWHRDVPYPLLLRAQHELASLLYIPLRGRDATLAQPLVEPVSSLGEPPSRASPVHLVLVESALYY